MERFCCIDITQVKGSVGKRGNGNVARSCFCGPARPPIRLQRTIEQYTEEAGAAEPRGGVGGGRSRPRLPIKANPNGFASASKGWAGPRPPKQNIGAGVKYV